jgi:hypothetical protein
VTGGALTTDYVTVTLSGSAQATSSATSSKSSSSSDLAASTVIVVQTQTVVPAAATKSASYYDSGMWHTSYVIKNFPTLAPSAAGHHWNSTSH